jgi:sulfur carrier protein
MNAANPNARSGDAVTLTLNGEPITCPPAGCTLAQLLQQHGYAADSVATAVNAAFVPRQTRETTQLHPGDAVTVIQPIVGG